MATTSGTTSFNMEVDEILEEAFDIVGGEHVSGHDAKKARRALNLLLIEYQNKNIPLSVIEEISQTLTEDTDDYTLDTNVLDILYMVLRRDGNDQKMKRLTRDEYLGISNKTQTGRPTQYTTERETSALNLTVWPVPENSTDELIMHCKVKIEDVTKSAGQILDIHPMYLPSIIYGLAYNLSLKRENIPVERRAEIKMKYQEALNDVFGEDEERVSFYLVPEVRSPLRG